MNRRRVLRRIKVDADRPVQDARFVGSYTSLSREGGEDDQCGRMLLQAGYQPKPLVAVPGPGRGGGGPHFHPAALLADIEECTHPGIENSTVRVGAGEFPE